jgi:hypothetical protein
MNNIEENQAKLKIKDIIRIFNRQLNDYIVWILCELDEISYNSQYIIFHLKNQAKFDYIVSQQIYILRRNVNVNATAQLI